MAFPPPRTVRLLRGSAGALIVGLAAVGGWSVTDALEQNDDFCNACHDHSGLPLHREIRSTADARPAMTLAAAHRRQAERARHSPQAFRCIDCHGGVGFVGRARVKALAARDAFWWTVGRFKEPDHMRSPLWDADCRQCHREFAPKGDAYGEPAFHDLPVHDVELGVNCVECHLAHERDESPGAYYLHKTHVRRQCARCHPQFEERQG